MPFISEPEEPVDLTKWKPVPKVGAALITAVAIIIIVTTAGLVGIDLADEGAAALVLVVASLGPVIAAYIKADDG
jgi:hypothetical protein